MIESIPLLLKVSITDTSFLAVTRHAQKAIVKHSLNCVPHAVIFSEKGLEQLYGHVPGSVLDGLKAQFTNKRLCYWIVTGENAIDIVNEIKGSNNDPNLCGINTLRYELGCLLGCRSYELSGGIVSYDNFVHAPKKEDVKRELVIFDRYTVFK